MSVKGAAKDCLIDCLPIVFLVLSLRTGAFSSRFGDNVPENERHFFTTGLTDSDGFGPCFRDSMLAYRDLYFTELQDKMT